MTVFDQYAEYYDLLYQDKNSSAEALYVAELILSNSPDARNILEVGSGTGRHALLMASLGFHIHGIDMSESMVRKAEEGRLVLDPKLREKLRFSVANLTSLDLSRQFDVVMALFNVMSYQASDEAFSRSIESVKEHCRPGGLFLFDFWYGPAVQKLGASQTVKEVENDRLKIVRTADPVAIPEKNCVDVNISLRVTEKGSSVSREIFERHRMRYFFQPELEESLKARGFSIVDCHEWMSGDTPSNETWSVTMLARRTN